MDELDLKILLSIDETRNITRSAAKLFLSQPALTKRLQNIEKDLGAALFLRSKSGITLTPFGEQAIETARDASDRFEDLRVFIQKNQGYVGGTLNIASSLDFSRYCMPDILMNYITGYPNVTLQVQTSHSSTNYQKLAEGQYQAAIIRGDYPWDDRIVKLCTESICLIRSREDEGKPLSSLRYINRYTDSSHMNQQTRWLIEHHLNPKSTVHVDSLSTCVKLTESGLGWSIVPSICLRDFKGICEPLFFEDGTPLTRSTYMLWRSRDSDLPQLKAFIETVLDYAKRELSYPVSEE